jgi:hypothetical protein
MYNQQVAQKKPTAAAVLSIIAGVIGLVLSLLALIGWIYIWSVGSGYSGYNYYDDFANSVFILGIALASWYLVSSILVLVGGTKLNSNPAGHTRWGIVILIFSIIGLGPMAIAIPDWTGILGLLIAIMGIVGGILALVFKPAYAPSPPAYAPPYQQTQPPYQPTYGQPQQQYPPPQAQRPINRICPNCGRVIDENLKFCPHCGKQLA